MKDIGSFVMFAHNCRKRPKNKLTKVLTYRYRLSQGSRVKKHQEVQVVKATRNKRENYLKGMLTQLLYARGDAQRINDKNKNKKKIELNARGTFVAKT